MFILRNWRVSGRALAGTLAFAVSGGLVPVESATERVFGGRRERRPGVRLLR